MATPWGAIASAGASILGGALGSSSAKKARKAQERAAERQIGFARESRDIARGDQAPYREGGYTALAGLMGLSGLPVPQTVSSAARGGAGGGQQLVMTKGGVPAPNQSLYMNDPVYRRAWDDALAKHWQTFGEGYTKGSNAAALQGELLQRMTRDSDFKNAPQEEAATPETVEEMVKADPSYDFRLNESMRALERGAAARGGLLSGGFGRTATRYASDYASTEYGKIYDRIANIAGLGMTGAANSGNAVLSTGGVMANAASQAGYGRASGYVAQGNAWANAFNEISRGVGGVFDRGSKVTEIDTSSFPGRVTGKIGGY